MPSTNDTIYGSDRLIDVIYGDTTGDITEGRGGNDQIFGLGGSVFRGQGDVLYGDAANLRGTAKGGNDLIDGGAFSDLLHGDAEDLITDEARGGNDTLVGGTGTDTARGDSLRIDGHGKGGNDLLLGGDGDDNLFGDATFLAGHAQGGNDRLDGEAGNDLLWGDAQFLLDQAVGGNDTFVFTGFFGNDQVMDFQQGKDHLEFAIPGGDASDLHIAVIGTDTVITLEGYGSVTLVGFTGELGTTDLLFV